jgi:L(+)-tartrate dehydratase beta subunit
MEPMQAKQFKTPLTRSDMAGLEIGDVLELTGTIYTARDAAHKRLEGLWKEGQPMPLDFTNQFIFYAGPCPAKPGHPVGSIAPTTSMRMEKFEKEFIAQTGVKLVVGKGGMGAGTVEACKKDKALHVVFPAGCAVVAATQVEEIEDAQWRDLGMPETLWVCRVKEFGPLIVSIDTYGRNLFEENKVVYNKKKEQAIADICKQVSFIK